MPANRPHLKLNITIQQEGIQQLRYKPRFLGKDKNDVKKEKPDYRQMVQTFRSSLAEFTRERRSRQSERNSTLSIPYHVDYVLIQFQGQFDIRYVPYWYETFGLLAINLSHFNTSVLFAVANESKFQFFLSQVENFVRPIVADNGTNYDRKILYVKNFKLLSTDDIVQCGDYIELTNFTLAEFPLDGNVPTAIFKSLENYLQEQHLSYQFAAPNLLEVYRASEHQIKEIVRNFDIILNVTSALSTLIAPSLLNQPVRSYGFSISNSEEELPIIGIIDTGISEQTPLQSIIVSDNAFNLTDSSAFIDNADHGTGVAALAALGRTPYTNNFRGDFEAHAKLLPIKILDDKQGAVSTKAVIDLLERAKATYPNIKIFVLSVCYNVHKRNDEEHSYYAYALDKFSHDNDCLVLVATANTRAELQNNNYNYEYFTLESSNLCVPAESMNNLTVGAAAEALREGYFCGISPSKEYPSLYTRKFHIDLKSYFPQNKINKHYFKPDVIEAGGDYEAGAGYISVGERASIEVLSSNPQQSFYPWIGTSYSAPLVANIAARILKLYPTLTAQTIKALIINAASTVNIRFPDCHSRLLPKLVGNGLVSVERSIYSNDNAITLIIEDNIRADEVKIYPLRIPSYLVTEALGKKQAVIKINATLCFSFAPVQFNQLAYCPLHMAFSIFRNKTHEDILEHYESAILRERWSQDAYYVSKPIVYSNSQKISFVIGTKEISEESGLLKIAVNCRIHPQLLPGQKEMYNNNHNFSLVITIEENLPPARMTGNLYNQTAAANEVESIVDLTADDIDLTVG